jgi:predicted deacetylase
MDKEKLNLEVGQPVMVTDGYGRTVEPKTGTVLKVARVWVTVAIPSYGNSVIERAFRMDNQTDGGQSAYCGRFYTMDQWAARKRLNEATKYLQEQGISVNIGSPWRGREVELADIIRAATS